MKCFVLSVKMNEIVNTFLLVGDKFMPEMHLKQPGFTYSACGPFTKNKERKKNFFFDLLDDIVNKYNKTVHRSIKVKPMDVTSDSYAEYNKDSNKKDPKLKVGDHIRISKYNNIFDTLQIGQKKFLLLAKLKIQSRGYILLMI